MSNFIQIYRNTTVGVTLQETLDEMISQGSLTERAASKILHEFDRSVNTALTKHGVKKFSFSGHLNTYRFCDSVWTFVVKDFSTKDTAAQHNQGAVGIANLTADKVKIVACDAKSDNKRQ